MILWNLIAHAVSVTCQGSHLLVAETMRSELQARGLVSHESSHHLSASEILYCLPNSTGPHHEMPWVKLGEILKRCGHRRINQGPLEGYYDLSAYIVTEVHAMRQEMRQMCTK
jgi:hypothetical protein